MNITRIKRINGEIQKVAYNAISSLVSTKFPGIIVSLTKVDTTDDLSFSKLYVSVFSVANKYESGEVVSYIKKNISKVREAVAHGVNLRITPTFSVILDDSQEKVRKIETLLTKIKKTESDEK